MFDEKAYLWLFLPMRIMMPIGLIFVILSFLPMEKRLILVYYGGRQLVSLRNCFFALGIAGMLLMPAFTFVPDNTNVKANRIEQCTNALAQICFFVGLLFML